MKIKKQIALNLFLLVLLLIFTINVYAERSWDNKTENENISWEQKIARWEQNHKSWSEKRDNLHEQYFDEYEDEDEGKYCNKSTGECWEEGIIYLIYTKNGQTMEFEKDSNDADVVFLDKSRWECVNGGQELVFHGVSGEYWESENEGQGLEYKNARGDHWYSDNIGQGVGFEGADGEKWVSDNDGQVVEHTDKNGNIWSGSDDDTVDDID